MSVQVDSEEEGQCFRTRDENQAFIASEEGDVHALFRPESPMVRLPSGDSIRSSERQGWEELDKRAERPCYWPLRLFGLWHPATCTKSLVLFHLFVSALVFSTCCALVIYLDVIHKNRLKKVKPLEIMNSCCTVIDFVGPFIFTVWYFKKEHYAYLLHSVRQNEQSRTLIRRWKWIYSSISGLLWLLCSLFFYFHWRPFLKAQWQYYVYLGVVIILGGYWSIWLSIYAFVCAVHCIHLKTLLSEQGEAQEEILQESTLAGIIIKHKHIMDLVKRSQSSFNCMISMSVAYHVVDIAIFSSAFWQHDFGPTYGVVQYLGTLTFDLLTIFIKVYPAGKVSAEANAVGKRFNKHVTLSQNEETMDHGFAVYHFLSIRSKEICFKILGVPITQNVSYAIIVTIAMASITFTSAITPFLKQL